MDIDGVADVETDVTAHTATVTYDDEKTDVAKMQEALREGGYPAEGEPKLLK